MELHCSVDQAGQRRRDRQSTRGEVQWTGGRCKSWDRRLQRPSDCRSWVRTDRFRVKATIRRQGLDATRLRAHRRGLFSAPDHTAEASRPTGTDEQFVVELNRMLAALRQGHTALLGHVRRQNPHAALSLLHFPGGDIHRRSDGGVSRSHRSRLVSLGGTAAEEALRAVARNRSRLRRRSSRVSIQTLEVAERLRGCFEHIVAAPAAFHLRGLTAPGRSPPQGWHTLRGFASQPLSFERIHICGQSRKLNEHFLEGTPTADTNHQVSQRLAAPFLLDKLGQTESLSVEG